MLFLQAILTLGDKDLDGRMDLEEFVQFVNEQQRKLWEVFSRLDANGDGNYVVLCVLVLCQAYCSEVCTVRVRVAITQCVDASIHCKSGKFHHRKFSFIRILT